MIMELDSRFQPFIDLINKAVANLTDLEKRTFYRLFENGAYIMDYTLAIAAGEDPDHETLEQLGLLTDTK